MKTFHGESIKDDERPHIMFWYSEVCQTVRRNYLVGKVGHEMEDSRWRTADILRWIKL